MTPEALAALLATPEFRTAVLAIVRDSLTVSVDTGYESYSGRDYVMITVSLDGEEISSGSFGVSS